MKKIIMRFLCISSFAAMPLLATDDEPTPADEKQKQEIIVEDVMDLEEPRDEVAADEIAALEDEINSDVAADEEEKNQKEETSSIEK